MDKRQKRGTSQKPCRFARIAAGIAVTAITVAGIGTAAGGASASTDWGTRVEPPIIVLDKTVVIDPDLAPQSTGWGS